MALHCSSRKEHRPSHARPLSSTRSPSAQRPVLFIKDVLDEHRRLVPRTVRVKDERGLLARRRVAVGHDAVDAQRRRGEDEFVARQRHCALQLQCRAV